MKIVLLISALYKFYYYYYDYYYYYYYYYYAQLSFTNFVCRWQGSVHDSAVFNGSMLHAHLEDGGRQNGWLLGNRGYGIQPYLLIPLRPDDVSTAPQSRYQKARTKTGNTMRGPLAYGSPDLKALMYLVGHCNLILIIVAPSLQRLLCCTTCASIDKTPLLGYIEQPPCEPGNSSPP